MLIVARFAFFINPFSLLSFKTCIGLELKVKERERAELAPLLTFKAKLLAKKSVYQIDHLDGVPWGGGGGTGSGRRAR